MTTLDIEWRHLVADGNTCERCDDTGAALRRVLADLTAELQGRGVTVQFRELALGPAELAESNLIRFNGRAIEDWLGGRVTETHCASCCDMVGETVCCRAVELDGRLYEAIPETMIRNAAYAALAMEIPTMKQIKVLGSGCANCETTAKLIQETAKAKGIEVAIEKVQDMGAILGYGVMSTPGIVIDGKVVHAGGVPDRKKIEGWLG